LSEFESDPEAATVPWKFYGTMPNSIHEQKIFGNAHGSTEERERFAKNQFGAMKFPYVCADFKPDIVLCFPESEMVLTEDGYKSIKDIKKGELVLTHKGRWRPVTATMQREANELVNIKAYGIYDTIDVTPEHPFYVIREGQSEPEFIEAKNLKCGDNLLLGTQVEEEEFTIDCHKYNPDNDFNENIVIPNARGNGKPIKRYIKVDKEFARLLGYYIGDGGRSWDEGIRICFEKHEQDYVDDVKNLLESCFNAPISSIKQSNGDSFVILMRNKLASQALWQSTNQRKFFTKEILRSPKKIKEQFICGLFRANGTYHKRSNFIALSTSKENIALNTRALLASLRRPPVPRTFTRHH
jgi:intein/homing endonuclease